VSDKSIKTLIIAGVLVVGAWFAWRYYQNYKAGQTGGGVPQLGTNLNSVAPELVGGSTGPAVAPAVNTPINITITDNTSKQMPETPNVPMLPGGANPGEPLGAGINNPLEQANSGTPSTVPEDAATQEPLMKTSQRNLGGGY
jgi:hypothetical protein